MTLKLKSYAVINCHGDIVAIDSGVNCKMLAAKMNNSRRYRDDHRPFKYVYIDHEFNQE